MHTTQEQLQVTAMGLTAEMFEDIMNHEEPPPIVVFVKGGERVVVAGFFGGDGHRFLREVAELGWAAGADGAVFTAPVVLMVPDEEFTAHAIQSVGVTTWGAPAIGSCIAYDPETLTAADVLGRRIQQLAPHMPELTDALRWATTNAAGPCRGA